MTAKKHKNIQDNSMTKSKITLFTPEQKFVIYIEPTEQKDKRSCNCTNQQTVKFTESLSGKSESRSFLEEHLAATKTPQSEVSPYQQLEVVQDSVHETFRKETVNRVVPKKTDDVFEDTLTYKRTDNNKISTDNDIPKMYGAENPQRDSSLKSILNRNNAPEASSKTGRKTNFALGENDVESARIEVDTNFVKNVATIIEASTLGARRQKLNDLLRNISVAQIHDADEKPVKTKTAGCWPISKFQKKVEEPHLYKQASLPFLNHSFYHYRAKSRLEGLTFIPHKVYNYGEKGSGFQSKAGSQDFYELRAECLAKRRLFEDPEFLPKDSSLFFSHRPDRTFEWKRPGEIVDNPQLFVEGFSRFDVQQGELGDCWLLAAVANLTLYRRLFSQIVPDDQSFDENYAGIFHFRFWQYGRWIDVVIDDRLPTSRGELVFLHSSEANEFWSALLEKAYAKLYGSYEALKGGSTCEAMEDFTGGVSEMYEIQASPPNLFKIILKAYERWSLMGCSIEADPDVLEAQTPEGLVRGHAYSITKVHYVDLTTPNNVSGKIPLLRLRNPWGNESEWNGAWSDNSPEWSLISEEQKQELGLIFEADGEFWMSFKDFQNHFNRLEICNLNPDSLSQDELTEGRNKRWVMSVFEGEWVRGVTAGGCRNFLDTFYHNPQYRVTLDEVDEGDEDKKCTIIVALMQKNRRQLRLSGGIDLLTIGFAIYYLPHPDRVPKPLDLNFFRYNASVVRSPSFINLREVSCRFKLPRGTYCIVPSTFDPNEEGEFLLRVFSEHQNHMEENDQKLGLKEDDTTVTISQLTPSEEKENQTVLQLFKTVAGKDEEVDWKELKEILDSYTRKETRNRGFSKDVCRSMIAMLDIDRSGKLNFEEFKRLWMSIRLWKNIFRQFDKSSSGTLNGFELRQALSSAGCNLNNHILNILMHRYGNKDNEIEFDDFIMCAVKLKIMIELFNEVATSENSATFTLEDWIENTLYA